MRNTNWQKAATIYALVDTGRRPANANVRRGQQILLKTLTGKHIAINANDNDTVKNIIRKVINKGNNVKKLVINGRELNGNTLWRNTNWQKVETIYVV